MKPTTLFYCANSHRKAPLFNSKNYTVEVSGNLNVEVPPHHEMVLLGYLAFSEDIQVGVKNCHIWLSSYYNFLEIYQRDIFINKFIEDHPLEDHYERFAAPAYAIDGLFSFFNPPSGELITITAEQELELMRIVQKHRWESRKPVAKWFTKYYLDRGMWSMDKIDAINAISVEFISCKGYAVSDGKELLRGIYGVAGIATILFYIGGGIVMLMVLFMVIRACMV